MPCTMNVLNAIGVFCLQQPQEFHIPITKSMLTSKISKLLADESGLSQQAIKQAMQKGAVWLESQKGVHRIRRASTVINEGDILHFYYAPHILEAIPPEPTLIADEQHYSVWYKPPGMLCQGAKWGDHWVINRWVETEYTFDNNAKRNCFIIHRLDKAARGLLLIGHTKKATQQLAALFAERKIEKNYQVIVEGEFPEKEKILDSPIDDKASLSIAKRMVFDEEKNQSLLYVNIKTGRKHQIRRHLSEAGFPVVGDRLYGSNSDDGFKKKHDQDKALIENLQLASCELIFDCPITMSSKKFNLPNELQLIL